MTKISLGIMEIAKKHDFHDELISSLKDNIQYVYEIIFTGSKDSLNLDDFEGVDVKYLNLDTDNKAVMRNSIIEASSGDYILWLSNNCEIEFDFIEEFKNIIEEYQDVDIVYPNKVVIDIDGEESIFKYLDYYKNEIGILRLLNVETAIPEFGVFTKNEIFNKYGNFNEGYKDFEFYEYLWRNVNNLNLKLSKFSFIVIKDTDTFIDTSYHSKALRDNIKNYDLKTIFPFLNWQHENIALSTANYLIGEALSKYYDLYNASEFFRKSAIAFHNKKSVDMLVYTYYMMGLFDMARELIREDQGFSKEEIERVLSEIQQTDLLIQNIEESLNEGKVSDIFNFISEVYGFYKGAPVLNILGFIEYISGNKENAYRFFYKAATMNPLNDDIINNLVDVSKELGKEEDVKGLFERILK